MGCQRWLKLTLAYDGAAYRGWQVQPNEPTVQAAVEAAWTSVTGETTRVTVAGRTDAGVHATGQVAGVATQSELGRPDLMRALNARLPEDIALLRLDDAPEGFHATHDAIGKLYRYRIHNGRVRAVFDRHITWHYPQPLDAQVMHQAAQLLVGRHDFSSFESAGSQRPDPVRTITHLAVCRGVGHLAERITIDVEGDGFLYNMVRSLVGTLIDVGRGARDARWLAGVLDACDRRRAGQTAPAHGLTLVRVDFDTLQSV